MRKFGILLFFCLILVPVLVLYSKEDDSSYVYLPIIINGSASQIDVIVGDIPIRIESEFMPSEMVANEVTNKNKAASAFSLEPFEEFSVVSMEYGMPPPSEQNLPEIVPGGANSVREALITLRVEQGGIPSAAPILSLFGQNVRGNYSVVELPLGDSDYTSVLVAEWVVEANSKMWIIRTSKELDGESPDEFLSYVEGATVSLSENSSAYSGNPKASSEDAHVVNNQDTIIVPWWVGECNVSNHPGSYRLDPNYNYEGFVACGPGDIVPVYFYMSAPCNCERMAMY